MLKIAKPLLGSVIVSIMTQTYATQHSTLCTYQLKNHELKLEYAQKQAELMRGLMYRTQLPGDQGMLFVLPTPRRAHFWMKNTHVPLSIAYLDQNMRILEIYDLQPHNLKSVSSQAKNIKYALEVNQGWFDAHSIQAGSVLKLSKKNQNTTCQIS